MSLERRLSAFQTKVQQQIDLQDDEIARLADYLKSIEAEIVETQDALRRFDIQSTQARQAAQGARRQSAVRDEARAARMRSDHHSLIHDMQESHSNLLEQMHSEFTEALSEIESQADQRAQAKIQPVNAQIQRIQKVLENIKGASISEEPSAIGAIADLEQNQRVDQERIRMLEVALRDKNQDRLASLSILREQLGDCVATLEDLEQSHAVKVDKLRTQLQMTDEKYDQKVGIETEKHQRQVKPVKRKIAELEKQIERLEVEAKKFRDEHAAQMLEMAQARDRARMELQMVAAKDPPSRAEILTSLQTQAQCDDLRSTLAGRERALDAERANNAALKRELARLRMNARIAQRRAALNL